MNNKIYDKLIFELSKEGRCAYSLPKNGFAHYEVPAALGRAKEAELPEVDEETVVRHYTNHSGNNFGVDNGFYPLGSCTMKYNPKINEEVAAMPGFNNLHPLQPIETAQGALSAHDTLRKCLSALTGLYDFTLKPCAGAHGELAGLMIIRAYHEANGQMQRTKVIVPDSAHGTNPASAAVCGLEIVEVKSTADGIVDVEDLKGLLDDTVAAMMMTNPNTLGLFEANIPEIAKLVHDCGGLITELRPFHESPAEEEVGIVVSPLITAMVKGADMSIDDEEIRKIEQCACPGCGSCSGMFTANSMNSLTEAMGLSLPGNGTILATHANRVQLFKDAARLIVKNALSYYNDGDESVLPRSIATRQAFLNAMTLDIAMGGSTNTVLHLLAVAQEAEVDFRMNDIDILSRKVPCLCKLSPNTQKYSVQECNRAGGFCSR